MANVFRDIETAGKWIAMESLDLLESKRSISQFFNTDYSKEFKLRFPVGKSIEVPFPMQFAVRNGLDYDPQAITRRHATISIGDPFGVDFELDSIERALQSPRSREQFSHDILDPAMTQLAQEIDSRCALYAYQHAAGVVGALGTNPSTYDATSAAARQKMQELGAPAGERAMIVPPVVHRTIKAANVGLFNPVSELSKMFRTGLVGASDGFEWYESMSLYRHTAGTLANSGATVTTAPSNGATTLALTCTTGETVKAGDKFAIASVLPVHPLTKRTFGTDTKVFTITADGTAASSALTITFSPACYYSGPYQNVDAQPAASAALTFWPGTTSPSGKAGMTGLALPRNAFALVGVELETFTDVEVCAQKRDPDSGISVRYVRASDPKSSKKINRFDVCIGFGEFYNDLAQVVACG